jgi:hypothetical protein
VDQSPYPGSGAQWQSHSHTWQTRQWTMGARVSAGPPSRCFWKKPCPHSAPLAEQAIAMRSSRASLSPRRTPVMTSTFRPASSAAFLTSAAIGSILICRVQ